MRTSELYPNVILTASEKMERCIRKESERADKAEAEREQLRADLESETRWANEYHQQAEKAEAEIEKLKAENARLRADLQDFMTGDD